MKTKLKKVLFVLAVILFLVVCAKGFSNEDDWICSNGQWIKHGSPSAPMPDKLCDN